jgi:predicted TIM-barrel fold metal-dependent hydrolase/pimeloyl-ACP methyl ester carboxylesterase
MKISALAVALPLLVACTSTSPSASVLASKAPVVDYHQHLISPAFAPIVKLPPRDGAALVRELDAAGIERGVVLSVGYSFSDERKDLDDPDRLTREENDWTAAEVTRNAPRLIGFCSANPLRAAALDELQRCLGLPGMAGIKLHLGNSGLSLRNLEHLERVQQLFALAQRWGAPVLVHMRARGGKDYGAEDARIFLDQVVPVAPEVEIIVAHFGASGPGYSLQHDEVMAVFAAAAEREDPRMETLYFDVASNVTEEIQPADAALIAERIRQLGTGRVLYGSDLSPPGGSIARGWELFRTNVPLNETELQQIARNLTRFATGREAPARVSFSTPDEGVVYADLYGSGEHGVVLAHGGRFDKESWAAQATVLENSGFRVLAIDFRGIGESHGPGDTDSMSAPLHFDVLAAVRYLRATGAKRVSVVGASMGGSAAADAVAQAEPGEIDRLVLLGSNAGETPEKLSIPTLFILARDDVSGTGPRLPRIRAHYEAVPGPRELLLLDGSAHAQFLFRTAHAERLMQEIVRFLSAP